MIYNLQKILIQSRFDKTRSEFEPRFRQSHIFYHNMYILYKIKHFYTFLSEICNLKLYLNYYVLKKSESMMMFLTNG